MRVLVTGGTGVIGAGLLPELIAAGHEVRLLTRHADREAREWPRGVEPFSGDITSAGAIAGAADGCDAVIHVSGIVSESPPDSTFEKVNVAGTRNVRDEATARGAPRFVYVSSLGAGQGASGYHASKRAAEAEIRDYAGSWAIVRPGGVYGPGDEVMSLLIRMFRTLPAMPVVGFGNHQFQPIFFADLGEALTVAAERHDLTGTFELAGEDMVTPAGILDRLRALTDRRPLTIPIPEPLAGAATRIAEAAGMPFPIDEAKFRMLVEHNVIDPPWMNALRRVFGVRPTSFDEGLRWLVDAQPEQQPREGVGAIERKRFWADIGGSRHRARELMVLVRERCTDAMTVEFDAEPGTPREIVEGATLTAALPLRGNIQVRVEEVEPDHFTLATLRGHPLAGTVRFEAADLDDGAVRFMITIGARAATVFDWIAMKTLGRFMQDDNWRTVVERVVEMSGGQSGGVRSETESLDAESTKVFERDVADLIAGHRRRDRAR
jgi:NADH dehydrogenase